MHENPLDIPKLKGITPHLTPVLQRGEEIYPFSPGGRWFDKYILSQVEGLTTSGEDEGARIFGEGTFRARLERPLS